MTFNGQSYETIIELERLIVIQEFAIKMYEAKVDLHKIKKEKEELEETRVMLNLHKEFYNKLSEIEKDLINKIDEFNRCLNDTECEIFVRKFVKNQTNNTIKDELYISDTTLDRHIKSIKDKLNEYEVGKKILSALEK